MNAAADIRLTIAELTDRADKVIAKVDLWGARGVTMLSVDQIEAVVILAALSRDGKALPREALDRANAAIQVQA